MPRGRTNNSLETRNKHQELDSDRSQAETDPGRIVRLNRKVGLKSEPQYTGLYWGGGSNKYYQMLKEERTETNEEN